MSAKARERVKCKECDFPLILKNLQSHYQRNHPNHEPSYNMIIDPNQSTLQFGPVQKKTKQDKETDEDIEKIIDETQLTHEISIAKKNYEDLDEEEQNFEQTLILITGSSSYEQLKDFTKKHLKYIDDKFVCEACSHSFEIVNINDKKKFSNLKLSLKRHLTSPSHAQNLENLFHQET